MAYDKGLLERLREVLHVVPPSGGFTPEPPEGGTTNLCVTEKKMFGGMCILVNGNMCCGIVDDILMARVGADQYEECLALPHAREMDFTGRPMKGMVNIDPEGTAEDADLKAWIERCMSFMNTLPPK